MKKAYPVMLCVLFLCGCASMHSRSVQDEPGDRVTVGNVQREIRRGMSGAEVVAVLGSPNIVSTDENGWEVWVYDKISTDVSYSKSDAGIGGLLFGSSGGVLGSAGFGSGAKSTSQKTLTVVIKFDAAKKVRDFAYHSSRF